MKKINIIAKFCIKLLISLNLKKKWQINNIKNILNMLMAKRSKINQKILLRYCQILGY